MGSSPNARAIVGSAVEITVLSRFCMNRAQATISAVNRVRGATDMGEAVRPGGMVGSFIEHSIAARAAQEKPSG